MENKDKAGQAKPKVDKAILTVAIEEKKKALADNKIIRKDGKDHHS